MRMSRSPDGCDRIGVKPCGPCAGDWPETRGPLSSATMYRTRQWLILLVGLAFLTASALQAHIHLCFDGQEPRSSLHVADGDHLGHHIGKSQTHTDVDVDPLGVALAKPQKADLPTLAFTAIRLVLPTAVPEARRLPSLDTVAPRPPPRFLRPLLRAPPV